MAKNWCKTTRNNRTYASETAVFLNKFLLIPQMTRKDYLISDAHEWINEILDQTTIFMSIALEMATKKSAFLND